MENNQNINEEKQSKPVLQWKKLSKKGKAGIIVAGVVILAVGGFAGAKVANYIKKATMSPAAYYRYVEEKNREERSAFLGDYYTNIRDSIQDDSNKKLTLQGRLSDSAKAMLSMSGADFSGFQSVALTAICNKRDQVTSNRILIKTNDKDLLTINTYADGKNAKEYIQIPELTKSYLDASEAWKQAENEPVENSLLLMGNAFEKLPKTKNLLKEYEKYSDISMDSVKNVTKKKGVIEQDGVKQKVSVFVIQENDREVKKLLNKLCQAGREDTFIKDFAESFGKGNGKAYEKKIEELQKQIQENTEKVTGQMGVKVDENDRIVGRTITFSNGENKIDLQWSFPIRENKFACDFKVVADHVKYIEIQGKGTIDDYKINGEFTIGSDDSLNPDTSRIASMDKLVTMELKDYDLSGWKEGKVDGTVTYRSNAMAELANYSLEIATKGDLSESKSVAKILTGKDTLATIDINVTKGEKLEHMKPESGDTVYNMAEESQMEAYSQEINLVAFIEELQSKMGIDLSGIALMD